MRIAIIGAGFSGCQLTLELLRRARAGTQILLFDGAATFGRGVAFAARHDRLLLNVRVANMSPFEDDPSHFLRWLWANDVAAHPAGPIPPSGHAFVPRGLYGRYLSEVLEEAAAALPRGVSLRRVGHDVVEVGEEHERVRLGLEDGGVQTADVAVLCSGMLRPVLPPAPGGIEHNAGPRLITNPWDEAAIARVGPEDAVLVLGTGLTMIDVVTTLDGAGHRGPILALSRHGLLPRVHAPTRPWSLLAPPTELAPSVSALMRFVRREIRRARGAGYEWRDVIDALRPHTQRLWQRLPQTERRRFLRHVRAYWEVHRHRMAPEIAAQIDGHATQRAPRGAGRNDRGVPMVRGGHRHPLPQPRQRRRPADHGRLAGQLRRPDPRFPRRTQSAGAQPAEAGLGVSRSAWPRSTGDSGSSSDLPRWPCEPKAVRHRADYQGHVLGDHCRARHPRSRPGAGDAVARRGHRLGCLKRDS